jgi:hypothetical protein
MSRTIKLTLTHKGDGSGRHQEWSIWTARACPASPEQDENPVVTMLALPASAVEQLGSPDEITVTVKAAKRGSGTVNLGSHPDYDRVVRPI